MQMTRWPRTGEVGCGVLMRSRAHRHRRSRVAHARLALLATAALLAGGAAGGRAASGATPGAASASGGTGYVTSVVAAAGHIKSLPSGLVPALQDAANDTGSVDLNQGGCNPATATTTVPSCTYGDTHASKTIVLIGDSHAQMWFPAFRQIATQAHYKLVVLTKASCPAADIDVYDYLRKKPYVECTKFHQFEIARAKQLKPDILVLASLARGIGLASSFHSAVSDSAWQAGLAKMLSAIPAKKKYIVGDIPFLGETGGPDCLAAHEGDVQACSASQSAANSQLKVTAEQKAAAQAHATYINTTPWFCAQSRCYAVVGKYDVYSDNAHITGAYSTFLARALQSFL